MRFRVAVALVLMSASAQAQVSPADVKARGIYAKVVAFRTSAGHNQTAPMVAYLTGVFTAGGVPQGRHHDARRGRGPRDDRAAARREA